MDKPLSTKPEECHYSFFQHTQCEFFPCHKTAKPEDFNCLFCYCPLYALGDKCGGNFAYVSVINELMIDKKISTKRIVLAFTYFLFSCKRLHIE